MESSGQHQLQGKETTFQLEHGFIRFVLEEKKPASQNFTGPGKNGEKLRPVFHVHNFNGNKPIFLNPREMMQLAKWLPQIQTLAGRTKLNLDQAAKERADANGVVGNENDDKTVSPPNETAENEKVLERVLYQSATSVIKLTVDTYKGKVYIFLKRFFFPKETPDQLMPCTGGTQFSVDDCPADMLRYAQNCMYLSSAV